MLVLEFKKFVNLQKNLGPAMATRPRAEIGPLLAKHTPGDLKKFFFTLGGAEANENAIKLARV